jgi:hypothetical protein
MWKSSLKRRPLSRSGQRRNTGAGGSATWPASAPFAGRAISGCEVECMKAILDGRLGFRSGIPRSGNSLREVLVRKSLKFTDAYSWDPWNKRWRRGCIVLGC